MKDLALGSTCGSPQATKKKASSTTDAAMYGKEVEKPSPSATG